MGQLMRGNLRPHFDTNTSPTSVLSLEPHGRLCRAGAGGTYTVTRVHFVAAKLTGARFMGANCSWKNNKGGLSTACNVGK